MAWRASFFENDFAVALSRTVRDDETIFHPVSIAFATPHCARLQAWREFTHRVIRPLCQDEFIIEPQVIYFANAVDLALVCLLQIGPVPVMQKRPDGKG